MDLQCDGGSREMNLSKEPAEHAAEYLDAVAGIWPLAALAGAIALASAVRQLKKCYTAQTPAQGAAAVLINAFLSTVLSVSAALILPFFYPGVTPEVQIAVSCALAGIGTETLKQALLKKLGLAIVDSMSQTAAPPGAEKAKGRKK